MKLTVFGATGGTGKLIVERALGAGHDVFAYVRSPEKLVARHERLHVIKGELSDAAGIESAVQDADAIICVLTPRMWRESKDLPLASGTRNILAAMQKSNVRRLIFGWGPNIVRPHGRWNAHFTTMFALFNFLPPTRTFMEESMRVGEAIRNSDRDWDHRVRCHAQRQSGIGACQGADRDRRGNDGWSKYLARGCRRIHTQPG